MSITVLAVGKLREKPYRLLADEYLKRLSRFDRVTEVEVPDLPEPENTSAAIEAQLRRREGEQILQRVSSRDYVIALTIPGRQMTSEELSGRIAALRNQGHTQLVFIIGGSLGLGDQVLHRADEEWSMGPMTFPHQLARVMVLEQLYRSEKIAAGEKYHK